MQHSMTSRTYEFNSIFSDDKQYLSSYRLRATKKKSAKKSANSPIRGKSRYREKLEDSTEDACERAIQQRATENNVHSFGCSFGLAGEDVTYLDKQYLRVTRILQTYEQNLRAGYEVRSQQINILLCCVLCIVLYCTLLCYSLPPYCTLLFFTVLYNP